MHPGTKWCVLKSCTLVKSLLQLSPRVMSEAGDHVRVCPRSSSDAPSRSRAVFFSQMSPALSGASGGLSQGRTDEPGSPGTRARAEKKPKCKPGSDYSEFSRQASPSLPVCSEQWARYWLFTQHSAQDIAAASWAGLSVSRILNMSIITIIQTDIRK